MSTAKVDFKSLQNDLSSLEKNFKVIIENSEINPVTPEMLEKAQKEYLKFSHVTVGEAANKDVLRAQGDSLYKMLLEMNAGLGSNRYLPRLFLE